MAWQSHMRSKALWSEQASRRTSKRAACRCRCQGSVAQWLPERAVTISSFIPVVSRGSGVGGEWGERRPQGPFSSPTQSASQMSQSLRQIMLLSPSAHRFSACCATPYPSQSTKDVSAVSAFGLSPVLQAVSVRGVSSQVESSRVKSCHCL